MVRERVHRSWTRTPSHHHWRKMRLQTRFHLHSWADVNALIASSDLSWNKIVILLTRKSREKVLWMGLLESAQVHGTFVSRILRAAFTAEEILDHHTYFCGTCIPVQWTVSMVSDMQAMTSELSCNTRLSSYVLPPQVPTVCFTHGSARMPMLLSQFIQPPSPSLPPHPHIFSLSSMLLFPCPTNVAL